MANNRLIVQSGQTGGVVFGTYDVFGTNTGNETVRVFDGGTAYFQGDFSRGGDTIQLTDVATDFTVRLVGSNVVLTSVSDGITVYIPMSTTNTTGTTIVFENSAGGLTDTRVLRFDPLSGNVQLGGQNLTTSPVNVAPAGGGNSSNTIILTAGLDTTPGGTADDTFLGFNTTLNAGDQLDGGTGYNTLKVATDASLTVQNYGGFTTVNIQRIEFTNDDAQPISIDLSGSKGVEVVAATNSSQDIAFNQLTTLAAIELNNVTNPAIGGPDVTVQYQDSLVAGADTVVNVVIKTSKSDDLTIGSVSDANGGVETVNISIIEGNSTLDTLNTDLTNLNISGTKDFVIDDALNNTVRNINANGLTGSLDIDFSDNDGAGQGVTYLGAKGANTVLGGSASDNITTYDGDDFITTEDQIGTGFFNGPDGNDTVNAGNGNNTVISGDGNDSITSGTGNDVINANNGNNIVDAGDGNNSVTSGSGIDTITTGSGNDTINSGSNNDLIDSGAGNDLITIGAGQHTITAGAGDDTVVAGANFDARTIAGDVQDSMDFGDGIDELRISASNPNADYFTNVSNLEVLTITAAGKNVNLNPGVLVTNEAELAGINTINTDWNYTGNDTVNASSFTRDLTVNIGGYAGDTNGTGGGTDSIVTGSGNDTINAFGDGNITNADTIIGGAGVDTLNLDGDTTLGTTSKFSGIEVITLDDNEDPLDANTYDISLWDGNAPTANGTLTIDGTKLQSDEGVRISTLAVSAGVTGFSASILGGAGADTVISGGRGDTIKTGAGNDTVDLGQAAFSGGADSVELGTGDDTLIAGANLLKTDTLVGGEGTDTLTLGGIFYVDEDFTNVSEFEILHVSEGFSNTLAAEAQEAGFTTIVSANGTTGTVIDASGFTKGVVIDISATGGGLNNDVVRAGSGNDTVIAGVGNQNVNLGAGDDEIWVNGSEFDINDTLEGGDGNDTVVLDNTGSDAVNPVNVVVNLDIVTGIENFVIKSDGDRNVGTDADANTITFANGDVGTLTNINVDASKLSDPADSLKVTLAASLDDDDYMFTITGSSTQTIVQKLNLGVDNNVSFKGGTGVDTLIIDGGDLGSTISMDGGAGQDVIAQSGGSLSDDGFVNISNVEVLTGFTPGTINAVLGAEADQAGIIFIDDTSGNDKLSLDAAFNNDLTIDLEGGNDNYSALKSSSKVTFVAHGSVDANDTLVGGTGVNDSIVIGAETAVLNGMTKVENVNVLNAAVAQNTVISTNQNAGNLSVGATFLKVDASALDSADTLSFTQTGSQAISLEGGAGADTIVTGSGNDIINSGDGADVINAGNGNNTVNAGAGNDSVTTGSGNDSILGGAGNDTIFSNGGNDFVDGGDGDDQISTGSGVDTIVSGLGVDQIYGGTGGDTITLTADNQKDSVFYTQRMDSSTSNDRDTITGFESGTDIIDVRYVAELLSNYALGTAKLEFLGNFSEFGGAQGALTSASPGNVGIVFQQNTNTLWVDLNDDNVLNGDDLQIVLNGTSSVKAEDVLSGAFVGFTQVPSGTPGTVGTIIDERFVLTGPSAVNGPWTLDGGLGNDVLVLGNQNISTSTITNVEAVEITNNSTALMTIAQHNFFESKNGFVNTGTNQTLSIVDSGVFTGTAGLGVDKYILSSDLLISGVHNDFTLGAAGQDVQGGDDWDIIRTGALDTLAELTGVVIDGGTGQDAVAHTVAGISVLGDVLVLDAGDDISGATISGIESTIITESSVTMTAAQHGTTGLNGTIGKIYDAGDTGSNSPDTITLSTASNITGHADIENYVLGRSTDAFNDTFTVNAAKLGVNVSSAAGNDRVILTGTVVSSLYLGTYAQGVYNLGGGGDTLQINGTADIRGINGGVDTTFEALDLATNVAVNTVSLTEAQHDAIGAANITGAGADDVINLYTFDIPPVGVDGPLDDGVVTGSATIGTYNLNGLFDFTLGANFQDAIGDGANSQTVRVNGFTLTAASTLSGGTGAGVDALILTGTNDISLATVNQFESITVDGSATMTEGQYEGNGAINASGFNDTITLVAGGGNLVVNGDADIQNFVLNGAFDFTVAAAAQNVTGSAGANQIVRITGLVATGTIDGGVGGIDTLVLGNGADISGATISNFENTTITGSVTMTYAQYVALAPVGSATTDTITLVGTAQAISARNSIENYILANTAGNDFSFVNGTGTLSVVTSGSNNDIVRTGTQTSFAGVTLNLAGNTGFVGDTLVITTTNTDISGINGGLETTAETIDIVTNGTVSMTVMQHEGFTAPFIGAGVETVKITDAGTVNAEVAIENYDLSAAANTINVSGLALGVNIKDTTATGDHDTVVINGLKVTGTYALANTADVLVATNGADISGVNGGNATTLEILDLTGAITMTELQHDAFTTFNAPGANDKITLTDSNGNDLVTGNAAIETYELNGTTYVFTLGALAQNVTELATTNSTLVFGAGAYTGTVTGFEAGDIFRVVNGSNISGVTGSVTGVDLNFQNLNNSTVTMTRAQHEAFNAFTNLTNTQTVVITTAGAITAKNDIENYNLSAASNTITINALEANVNLTSTGATNDTVVVNAFNVGGTWALDGLNDLLDITGTSNISNVNGGAATTAESLRIDGDVSMTVAQYNGFTQPFDANFGGSDTIRLTTDGVFTADAEIEDYFLNANGGPGSTVTIGLAVNANITGANGADTINVGSNNVNATYNLSGGGDTLITATGANITNVNGGGNTTAETLELTGTLTLTGTQYNAFGTITGSAGVDGVNISGNGNYTAVDSVENYALLSNGNNTISFGGSDAVRAEQSVNLGNSNTEIQIFTSFTSALNGTDSSISVTNFTTNDRFNIDVPGNSLNANFTNVTAGLNTSLNGGATEEVIVINGLANTNLTDISNGGDVETAIANALGRMDSGDYLIVLESPNGGGQSGLYLINIAAGSPATQVGGNLDTSNFDVEFIGLVSHANGFDWQSSNFV